MTEKKAIEITPLGEGAQRRIHNLYLTNRMNTHTCMIPAQPMSHIKGWGVRQTKLEMRRCVIEAEDNTSICSPSAQLAM